METAGTFNPLNPALAEYENADYEAKNNGGPLVQGFRKMLNLSESITLSMPMEGMMRQISGALEWKRSLIGLIVQTHLEPRTNVRLFMLENPAKDRGICFRLIGTQFKTSDVPLISWSGGDIAKEFGPAKGTDMSSPELWRGPVLAVRYIDATPLEVHKMQALQLMMRDDPDEGGLEMCKVKLDEGEIEAAAAYFERARATLSPEAHAAYRARYPDEPLAMLSYLYVPCPDMATETRLKNHTTCDNAGCGKPGTKICSKCRTPYCSRECQTEAWKTHKRSCQAKASGELSAADLARPSVVISPDSRDPAFKGMHTMSLSMQGGKQTFGREKSMGMIAYQGMIVVKVQGPVMGGHGHFMIYDERRSFTLAGIPTDTEPGLTLHTFLRSIPGLPYPGQSPHPATVKVFLHAATVEEGLRIFLDRPAAFQKW